MTVVVGGWRYRRRDTAPVVLVLVSGLTVVAGLAGAVAIVAAYRWGRGGPEGRSVTDVLYGLGVPWALVGVAGAATLLRAVPDLWRRRVVEGTVVRRRVAYGEDAVEGHRLYLAIDDGRSDTLVAYPLGRERRSRIGTSPYHHLQTGDVARLTVAPGFGHVFRIEPLVDAEGRPLPPLGMLPATPPGAPVTAEEVSRTSTFVVRRVGEATTTHDGRAVRSWRFDLVDEKGLFVAVHLATGERGAEAIVAAAGSTEPIGRTAPTLPGAVRYDRGLLVVERGPVAVGVQASPFMGLPRGSWSWDEELARLALSRLTSGIKRKSR